ncbi:hypothetical protein ACP70R_044739 [Stipagrostis hirtigluma subsp. patula]
MPDLSKYPVNSFANIPFSGSLLQQPSVRLTNQKKLDASTAETYDLAFATGHLEGGFEQESLISLEQNKNTILCTDGKGRAETFYLSSGWTRHSFGEDGHLVCKLENYRIDSIDMIGDLAASASESGD